MDDANSTWRSVVQLPWIVVLVVLVASASELMLVPGFRSVRNLVPLSLNLIWIAFVPAALALVAGRALSRTSGRLRRVAMWSPLVAGVGIAMASGVQSGQFGWFEFAGAVFGAVVVSAVLPRFLPTLAEEPDGLFAPAGLLWVVAAAHFISLSGDLMAPDAPLMLAVLPFIGATAVLLQVVHTGVAARSTRLQVGLLAVGSVGVSAVVVYLATWLPPLNTSLKLLIALSGAFGLVILAEPLVGRAAPSRGWKVATLAAVLISLASLGIFTVDIADRFGGLDRRYAAAAGARLLSSLNDRDGDGFYAESAGGNDCDDDRADRHPLAPTAERNCLPEGSLQVATSTPASQHDVVVLIIDALRADEFYAPEQRDRFKTFAQFAKQSRRFTAAYAPGNSTYMSLPALLSGHAPQLIVGTLMSSDPVPYEQLMQGRTIFDRVPEERCTAMITATIRSPDWLISLFPSDVDFRALETTPDENDYSAHNVPDAVDRALEKCGDRPTLAVLYIDEPHKDLIALHTCRGGSHGGEECYYDEIAAVDSALEGLAEQYRRRGRWESAAVILTSDHGEAFGRRGHWGHSATVYEEEVHVPLWLRMPGVEPGDDPTPVSGLSIPPTAVALSGGTPEPAIYPSLVDLVEGRLESYPAPVTTGAIGRAKLRWKTPSTALRDGELKLIYDWATTDVELYDLDVDPSETNDLSRQRPEVTRRLRQRLLTTERALLLAK